jgi:hypothetical protein
MGRYLSAGLSPARHPFANFRRSLNLGQRGRQQGEPPQDTGPPGTDLFAPPHDTGVSRGGLLAPLPKSAPRAVDPR